MLLFLADDMGWSDLGCYGGEIGTPRIDALADEGTTFRQFYNTARCSPSRASLLTGLHPHQTGIGELVDDDGPGGYPGSLNDRCATLAETFAAAGYRTDLTGKWHLSHEREHSDDSWPSRRGFAHSWGTLGGAGSYFAPTTLHDGDIPVPIDELPDDFYYTDAIGERAAAAVTEAVVERKTGDRPFFGYVAFTAPHWPLHALDADLDQVRGRFDEGWDVLRARRREAQIAAGLCGPDDTLDVRDPAVPAWADEPEQAWQLRRMECYAAQLVAMDRAVGRVLDALEESGAAEDTIVVFLSDNGGCAEELSAEPDDAERFRGHRLIIPPSGPDGSPIEVGNAPSITPGGAGTYSSYGRSWANLSNTPFRLYKRWVHEGGIATPLIVRWPAGGVLAGGRVDAPHQLTDLAPTLYQATGVAPLDTRHGVPLPPLPGVSMLTALRGGPADDHDLYWEHIGNQALRSGRWKLVREDGGPWELYDLETDRSESHDLAGAEPERVAELASRWQVWADQVGALPREQVLAARARAGTQLL